MNKQLLVNSALTFCAALLFGGCHSGNADDDEFVGSVLFDNIDRVENGNIIITTTEVPVKLIGVAAGFERGNTFLKKFIGEEIHVIEDSSLPQNAVGADTIYGYVVLEDHRCINRMLLEQEPELYDPINLEDSLETFRPASISNVDIPDLSLYIKQRSFLIEVPLGGGLTAYGTGFFINDKGLAITNNHVLDGTCSASAYLYDPTSIDDSEIYSHLRRDIRIDDILWTDPEIDISVFRVTLKNSDQPSYFNLAKKHVPQGTKVGTIGNPVSQNAGVLSGSWSHGEVSAYRGKGSNRPLVQYTLSTNGGNSGGAVSDPTGTVIAVHDLGDKSMQNVNYGIDILAVRPILDKLGESYGGK